MYKFFGNNWQEVKGLQSGQIVFRFDSKGEFYTDDQKIIDRAIGHFDHILVEAAEVGERVKRTIVTPPIRFDSADIPTEPVAEPIETETNDEPAAAFICKYCHESFETFGKRQKHYMDVCPKKG